MHVLTRKISRNIIRDKNNNNEQVKDRSKTTLWNAELLWRHIFWANKETRHIECLIMSLVCLREHWMGDCCMHQHSEHGYAGLMDTFIKTAWILCSSNACLIQICKTQANKILMQQAYWCNPHVGLVSKSEQANTPLCFGFEKSQTNQLEYEIPLISIIIRVVSFIYTYHLTYFMNRHHPVNC